MLKYLTDPIREFILKILSLLNRNWYMNFEKDYGEGARK